jgi:phosphotransferase system HPr-like phosphotransfer protein
MVELVHFYERHENDIRSQEAKNRIAAIIKKDEVLDKILNFSLYYLHVYVDLGAPIAEALLVRYTKQTQVTLKIPEGVYLHARPVSLITRIVSHHGTPVNLRLGEVTCYAGSIINVLMAVGANATVREVSFEGDHAPLTDLRLFFEHGLGEGPNPLPKSLAYLGLKS